MAEINDLAKRYWRQLLLLAMVVPSALALISYLRVTTVVLVIRHADRLDNSADSPLNPDGHTRARLLIDEAGPVAAIFATPTVRSQQTVWYLADHLGLTAIPYPYDRDHRDEPTVESEVSTLVTQIRTNHTGQRILVAGHSETVHVIVRQLGGGTVAPIPSTQYDNLFVVTIPRIGSPRVVHRKYGAPTP